MKGGVACIILAFLPASLPAARKPHCTLRVHVQANANDGGAFAIPLRSPVTGKKIVIEKMPRISELDVVAFYPYQAQDGSYGALLNLNAHGRLALETLSAERRGGFVYVFVNGRPVAELQIDRRIADGKLYLASGLSQDDLQRMAKEWRVMGKKKSSKSQFPSSKSAILAHDASPLLDLALPTDNDALFHGGGPAFYQHVKRNLKGVISYPWQGGQYGFVRNPLPRAGGWVYTRFHEGIDIRPMRRDARGEPLDEVRAIADGTVAYINLVPRHSNYGNYVVVEHRWDGASYYSLYGHLASVSTSVGASVRRDEGLGLMGYTGEGLEQSRAHVHLELNLLLSRNFESWHDHFIRADPNRHGLYNGINLTGLDIARLYLAQRKSPELTIPQFLSGEHTFYRVILPASHNFDLPRRYPWLWQKGSADALAWEISFNRAGIPLRVEPSARIVTEPTLSFVNKRSGNYADFTRGVVGGRGDNAQLTESGQRLMRLIIWPE